jgi:hypothetical protein
MEFAMDITSPCSGQYEIHLTDPELRVVCNCINETCNGIALPEFEIRVGAERGEVEILLDKLITVLSK